MDLNNLFEDLDKLELDTSNSEQPGAVEIIKEPSLADDRLASDLAGQKHYWLYSARGDNWWLFRGEDAQTIEDGKVMGLDKVNIQSVGCQITVDLVRMIQTTSSGHFRNVKRVLSLIHI